MPRHFPMGRPARHAALALGVGVVATLITSLTIQRTFDSRQTESLFHARSAEATLGLATAVSRNVLAIEQMAAFHETAGGELSEEQFKTVATEILRERREIKGIGWAPMVRAERLAAFEAETRAAGHHDYHVFETDGNAGVRALGHRPAYFPVRYAEPASEYQSSLGFDVGGDAVRAQVLTRTQRVGAAQVSDPVVLQLGDRPLGTMIAHAIVNPAGLGVLGFVVAVVSLDQITAELAGVDPAHRLAITVSSDSQVPPPPVGTLLVHRANVPVPGGTWQIDIRPAGHWVTVAGTREAGWFAGLVGLLLSLGAAAYVYAKNRAHERLQDAHRVADRHRQEFQILSELTLDGAYQFGLDSEAVPLLWASDGFYRLTGWRPGEGHTRNDWLLLVHPDDRPRVARGFVLGSRGTGSTSEFRLMTTDGYRWVEDVVQPRTVGGSDAPASLYGAIRDITERREAHEALQRAHAELEAAFAAIPDLYFRLDAQGCFISFRAGDIGALYKPPEEFIGKKLEEVLPPPVAAQAREGLTRVQTTGRPTSIEYPLPTTEGEHWFETRAFPGRDGEILLFVRDITHRRRREQELAASEQRFRTLITSLPEPLMIVADGAIAFANPAAEHFFAAPTPALVGLPCHDLLVGATADGIEPCLTEGAPAAPPVALTFRRHDGTPVPVEVVAAATAFDGRPAMQIAFRDVSARKAAEEAIRVSEERFRQLAESADGAFWLYDPVTGTLPYVSPQATAIFGGDPVEPDQPFTAWRRAIHPGDRDRVTAAVRACLDGRTAEIDVDFRVVRADGTVRWVNDRARRLSFGESTRILGFARDITDKRLADESRARLEAQLRNVQKMEAIGTLAGGIAHDFNNILGAIMGYASLLELELSDQPRPMADLNQILAASTRAKALVQQILTFSRQQDHVRSPIRLQPVLREALGLLRAGIPSSIAIESMLEPGAPEVVADGTQVHQILMNLVTNASDAIGDNGTIRVRYEACNVTPKLATLVPELEPGAYTRLTVADDGPGMDAATLERIFEPFFTTKAPGKGTGLGLAVVHGIVKAHGGALGVTSEPGQGTTIDVYFPVAVAAPRHEPDQPDDGIAFGSGQHILVVDDEGPLALVCRKMLEARGYRVSTYTRPEEALTVFRQDPERFQAAVLDFTMPGMSGAALADQLAQLRPDFPILIMTGYAAALNEKAIEKLGVRRLLLKPLEMKALVNAVAETLSEASTPKEH